MAPLRLFVAATGFEPVRSGQILPSSCAQLLILFYRVKKTGMPIPKFQVLIILNM